MLKVEDLHDFWSYIKDVFEEEEIEDALSNSNFDETRLSEDNIDELSDDEVKFLYADLVYIVLNELGNGDFDTMYEILSETLCLAEEDINYLLDW